MADETITDLDMKILSHFRRDRLCGKCGGPIENDRSTTCWKCDTMTHVRTQLDWIDTASMNLAIKLDIRRPPPPARVPPPASNSEKSNRKKPPRKKSRKKPAKKNAP